MTKKSKSSKIKSGLVVAIPLENGHGYIYGKIVDLCDFAELDLSNTFHLLVYTYNYTTKSKDEFRFDEFNKSQPFVGGMFVLDLEPVVIKNIWTSVAETHLNDFEKRVPDFRGFSSNIFAVHKYEKDADNWNYFENGRPLKRIKASYDEVKHLEGSTALSHDLVEKRLSMEYLKRQGLSVEGTYDLEEWEELVVYYNMLFTTRFNEVPDSLKGKVNKN